ncbi:MAG: asparaginase [Gemmatimonadaceae bacterium]
MANISHLTDQQSGVVTPVSSSTTAELSLDVVVTRGGVVESRHRVDAAVVDANGELLHRAGNPGVFTWWRSCAKPFQVMPLVESGGLQKLDWKGDELALACASHGGEPEHVAIAESMLRSIGLEEGDLACGPHEPLAARGARLLRESGHRVTRLHNNCSGKHSAMLAQAHLRGLPTKGYELIEHEVQQDALRAVALWAGMNESEIGVGIDGCGVPVFALPLANMALSYARLVTAAARGHEAAARIVHAMTGHPFLIGGTERFDTALMQACRGKVLCKIGAEGVHTLALVDRGIGLAIKVEDGAPRAQYPAVLALLAHLGELPDPLPDSLREFAAKAVRNTRSEAVGEIRVASADLGERA